MHGSISTFVFAASLLCSLQSWSIHSAIDTSGFSGVPFRCGYVRRLVVCLY
jgi:hypothetical protein